HRLLDRADADRGQALEQTSEMAISVRIVHGPCRAAAAPVAAACAERVAAARLRKHQAADDELAGPQMILRQANPARPAALDRGVLAPIVLRASGARRPCRQPDQ